MSFFSLVLLRWRAFPPGLGLDLQKTCFLRRQPRTQTWDSWPLKEVPPNELGLTQSVLHGFDLTFFFFCSAGLGMYESPLFLAAHDEDGGGRSVPTTPLQVAAPGETHSHSLFSLSCAASPSLIVCLSVRQWRSSLSLYPQTVATTWPPSLFPW